jgi:hypothetical protein
VLRVAKSGDGTGVLVSDPEGILCDTACVDGESFTFAPEVTRVTLTAQPARDALFERWECTTRQDGVSTPREVRQPSFEIEEASPVGVDIECTAFFKKVTTLQVLFAGVGTGRVVGTLTDLDGAPRLSCPGDCTSGYFVDEVETLSATADDGSVFIGWFFCASGTNDIQVAVTEDQNCEARFDLE